MHYAVLTVGENGTPTFSAPVPIPGAVNLSMSPEGDTTPFYADGTKYYISVANNGYSGDLEIALLPDSFRKDVLGETEDATDKVMVENANVEPVPFALLFQFDGDKKGIRHVFFNCTATRRTSKERPRRTAKNRPRRHFRSRRHRWKTAWSKPRPRPTRQKKFTRTGIRPYGCPDKHKWELEHGKNDYC